MDFIEIPEGLRQAATEDAAIMDWLHAQQAQAEEVGVFISEERWASRPMKKWAREVIYG